jgi:hypothetical protein
MQKYVEFCRNKKSNIMEIIYSDRNQITVIDTIMIPTEQQTCMDL